MKKYLLIIISLFLFIPFTSVKANNPVNVYVFYKTKDAQYLNIIDALNEIKEDTNYKDKFKLVEYNINVEENKEVFDEIIKSYDKKDTTFAYSIGYIVDFYFPTEKTNYTRSDYRFYNSYNYYVEMFKSYIENAYIVGYDTDYVSETIKYMNYYKNYNNTNYDEDDNYNYSHTYGDEEFSALIEEIKNDKFLSKYVLNKVNRDVIIIIFLSFILLKRLKKSIKKNR